MLTEINGSMLKLAPAGALIGIPVNAIGVAGKGLAYYMKLKWSKAYEKYVSTCRKGKIATGDLLVVSTKEFELAFLPTKYHWKEDADTDLIKVTLIRLKAYMRKYGITEVHLPYLGCGDRTGRLNYEDDVKPLIEECFKDEPETVYVYKLIKPLY